MAGNMARHFFHENSPIQNPDSIHNPKPNCNPKNNDGGSLSSGEQEAVSSMVVQAEVDRKVTEKLFVFSLDHRQISLFLLSLFLLISGRSGLAVACLTAVCEVPGSNRAVGSCVYRTTTVIYSLGHGLCAPFLQCLGQLSLLPSVGR